MNIQDSDIPFLVAALQNAIGPVEVRFSFVDARQQPGLNT